MMPAAPPPPPPEVPVSHTQQYDDAVERLKAQREAQRVALNSHKKTVMEFTAQIREGTPAEPEPLPPKEELNVIADQEDSSELEGMATQVLEPDEVDIQGDAITDGFAALRAQRAQRKKSIHDLKQSTAGLKVASQRTMKMDPQMLRERLKDEHATAEGAND